MRLLDIEKYPINIQKLQVSRDLYNYYSGANVAIVDAAESYRILCRIFLHDDPCISNAVFVDRTVIIPKLGWQRADIDEAYPPRHIDNSDIQLVKTVKEAETLTVCLVFNHPSSIALRTNATFNKLVKNFLRQLVLARGAVIFCSSVPELNVHAIIVKNIGGKPCEAAKVTTRTQVCVDECISFKKYNSILSRAKGKMEDGLFVRTSEPIPSFELICNTVLDVLNAPSNVSSFTPDNKLLLVGPSGCGKTSLVSAVARHIQKIILKLECGDSSSSAFSEELSAITSRAKAHTEVGEKCLLLLKNIDRVCRSKNDKFNMKELVRRIEEIDRNIAVIATTDAPEEISMSLRRVGCLHHEIEFPMLTEDERFQVFRHLAHVQCIRCSDAVARNAARWTPGYLLADLAVVFREASNFSNDTKIFTDEILRRAVSATSPSLLRGTRGWITSKKTTFEDIGGLEIVKKELRMSILWQMNHPEAFQRLGIQSTKGILLFGPPGCAKTTLVKALANESAATFLAVSAADLYSPYVGESEKRVTKLFTQARIGAPTIIFIDEIDALVGSKGANRESGVQERILATLLMEMDGIGVNIRTSDCLMKAGQEQMNDLAEKSAKSRDNSRIVVVGATNRPELLDDALKRPGRFDKLIHIPTPNESERLAILRCVTAKMVLDWSVDLPEIARKTENFSGADLKAFCSEAALYAMTVRGVDVAEIMHDDFISILDKTNRHKT